MAPSVAADGLLLQWRHHQGQLLGLVAGRGTCAPHSCVTANIHHGLACNMYIPFLQQAAQQAA
jgi:hypothetical protein